MKTSVIGDDFALAFKAIGIYSREVMMEQMSKAGEAVKKNMRSTLMSSTVKTRTYRGRLVFSGSPRKFGSRESFSTGENESPDNMSSFINSFPAERSNTVVVAGSHPSFRPILRRDGKVIGVGSRVKGVGRTTTAILQRMDSGVKGRDYPKSTQLTKKNIATHWARSAVGKSNGSINKYLSEGYERALGRALNNISPRQMRIAL